MESVQVRGDGMMVTGEFSTRVRSKGDEDGETERKT